MFPNYCSIIVTPNIFKAMMAAINNTLDLYLSLLYNFQYGFYKVKSMTHSPLLFISWLLSQRNLVKIMSLPSTYFCPYLACKSLCEVSWLWAPFISWIENFLSKHPIIICVSIKSSPINSSMSYSLFIHQWLTATSSNKAHSYTDDIIIHSSLTFLNPTLFILKQDNYMPNPY